MPFLPVERDVSAEVYFMPTTTLTADVSDLFLTNQIAMCKRLSAPDAECRPVDLIGCWASESGVHAHAQNPNALASGFFQLLPSIGRSLGFHGDGRYTETPGAYRNAQISLALAKASKDPDRIANARADVRALDKALADAFTRLPLESQLIWAEAYYRPHKGRLTSATACYAANFVPAFIRHADTPSWVICAADGASDGLPDWESKEFFEANPTLDVDKDGKITMGDLGAAIELASKKPRAAELISRVIALSSADSLAAIDVTNDGADVPIYEAPAPEENKGS